MSDNFSYITVPNLDRWQHYKDRCPPWIKLHKAAVLDDYKFTCLQDASKAHLIAIWLLASQMDNSIPMDAEWIARKINATEPVDIKDLIKQGFLEMVQDASIGIADCKQSALAETETETETEIEIEIEIETETETETESKPEIKEEAIVESLKIANFMADTILARDEKYVHLINGKRNKAVKSWAVDIQKINRLDHRDWPEIWKVVKWCLEDDFWCRNILSGSKLRAKFSDLVLKMPARSVVHSDAHGGYAGKGKRIII